MVPAPLASHHDAASQESTLLATSFPLFSDPVQSARGLLAAVGSLSMAGRVRAAQLRAQVPGFVLLGAAVPCPFQTAGSSLPPCDALSCPGSPGGSLVVFLIRRRLLLGRLRRFPLDSPPLTPQFPWLHLLSVSSVSPFTPEMIPASPEASHSVLRGCHQTPGPHP